MVYAIHNNNIKDMKNVFIILFLVTFAGVCAHAQTQPALPPGSQIYSSNLFLAPDSSVWTGKGGLYINLGSWAKTRALVTIPDATIEAIPEDEEFDFGNPTYTLFEIDPEMREIYGDEPRVLLSIRRSSDTSGEWVDFQEGIIRVRGSQGEVTGIKYQTSGFQGLLIICR